MDDLTPDQAIEKLRSLPEDKQRAVLMALSPDERKGILGKLQPQTAGQKYQAARAAHKLPQKDVFTFRNNPQQAIAQAGSELGEKSQELQDIANNPVEYRGGKLAGPKSGLTRANAAMLSGVAGGGEVAAKLLSGLMDWKTAAGFLLSKISPAAGASFFATQGAKGAYDALKNGDTSPENVQNFLLSLAGVSGAVAGGAASGDTGITADKIRESLPAPKRALGKLVKETQAENVKGSTKAAEEQATHAEALGNEQARAAKAADIQKDSELLDVKTEKARHDALVEGNKKYSAVNEKLSPIASDPAAITDALHDSMGRISGTDAQPTILKSIEKRLTDENGISYSDLQGYYSELGRELSKGTLPGDVYSAYDTMHEAIGEQMQKIADANGAGPQLKEARAYWKRMKQTFGKSSDTAGNRASKFVSDESPEVIEKQQREYRERLLGSFDPEIPKIAERIRGARGESEAIPNKKAGPAPKPFKAETIGKAEVEAAKRQHLQGTADWIRNRGAWAASWPALYLLRDALRGQGFPIGEAVMEAGGTIVATHAIAHALENPAVVKFLTQATMKDIAAIPADLRGDFPGMVQQATKQGVKVSPALKAVFAGAANAPAPRRPMTTDEYSDPANFPQ